MSAETWFEVRPCTESKIDREINPEILPGLPALAEALTIAENARQKAVAKNAQVWDYSRRLAEAEVRDLSDIFAGSDALQDDRSSSRKINIKYNGNCYNLTLFSYKN